MEKQTQSCILEKQLKSSFDAIVDELGKGEAVNHIVEFAKEYFEKINIPKQQNENVVCFEFRIKNKKTMKMLTTVEKIDCYTFETHPTDSAQIAFTNAYDKIAKKINEIL